jgi:hypothetical protein
VWIAEDPDLEDAFVLTGRFSGYLDRSGQVLEQFQDLSAGEAVAWGRARADVVLIRGGDSDYLSAGSRNPDPERWKDWPPSGVEFERRRVRGFEALDSSEGDPPTRWDVRVKADPAADAHPSPYHDSVRAEPLALDVVAPAPGYPALSAAFMVEASTHEQAQAIADAIAGRALVASLAGSRSAGSFQSFCEVYPHRPDAPVTGPGVTP